MKMEPSTPRRSSRRNSFSSRSRSHSKESKNPYSTSGLDKFSALLAELEEKKQKIYSKVNPDEISLVRFAYKDSDDCVPIVVKIKKQDKQQQQQKKINIKQNPPRNEDSDHQMKDKFPVDFSNSALENKQVKQSDNNDNKTKMKRRWSFSFSWSDFMKLSNWRRPSYYLPAVIVLILIFLLFFGRSFAILCTSIGWYIVPTLKSKAVTAESNPNVTRRSMKKKEYVRIYSDNKMVTTAPKTVNNNHSGNLKNHDHKKSW